MAEILKVNTVDSKSSTQKVEQCPFVSEAGPSCKLCGTPPISVNIDPQGGYGFCDECGGKFRIKRARTSKKRS